MGSGQADGKLREENDALKAKITELGDELSHLEHIKSESQLASQVEAKYLGDMEEL